MHRPTLLAAVSLALLASTPARAAAQDFHPGDLWLLEPGSLSSIVRFDPFTGGATVVASGSQLAQYGGAIFDRFRNGIDVLAGSGLATMKADGTFVDLGYLPPSLAWLTSTGDGRVYFMELTSSFSFHVRYLDAANGVHDLLDATGSAPYGYVPASPFGVGIQRPEAGYYDPVSNALFFGDNEDISPCGLGIVTLIVKVPLSADGSKVEGAVQTASICPAGATTTCVPLAIGPGPGNTVLVVADDNSNDAVARMTLVDRTTMAAAAYAENGPYVGAAQTPTGVYSHLLGRALVVDPFNDVVRAYSAGESGVGTSFSTDPILSFAGAGVTLVEIPPDAVSGLAPYGSGTPGCAGPHVLFATGAPSTGNASFRFDCTHAPASSLGLLLVADVPSVGGADPFGLGVVLHLDLFASTFLLPLDLASNAYGLGESTAPIPIAPSFVGATVDAQALWFWSGCSPSPSGLSSSNGLAVTFLP